MTETIKLLELFSGIQSQEKALAQIGIPYESVGVCDCDKDVLVASAAMRFDLEKEIENYDFPDTETMIKELQDKNIGYSFEKQKHTVTSRTPISKLKQYYISDKILKNLGDISKVDKLPYADVVTYSFPCTDLSVAGKGEGMVNKCNACGHSWPIDFSNAEEALVCPNCGATVSSSTRSGLLGQVQRLLATAYKDNELPRILVMENVKNLVGKKFKPQFDAWLQYLDSIGYNTYWKVLNAKNFGVPQNRERCFAISIRKDIDTNGFTFPEPTPLTTRIKDILETSVDEKYYLPDERVEKILNYSFMQEKKRIQTTDVCDTLLARENPSDRTAGIPTEQRLEPNFSGTTNCLTSVAKDNYVCEPKIVQNPHGFNKGSIQEECPSITSSYFQENNYVVEPIVYDDYNSRISADQEAINTLTCNCGASAERNGVKIIEPVIVEDFYQSREPRVYSEVAPILRSERTGLKVADEIEYPCSTRGKQVASAIRASIYKQGARNLEENVVNGLGYEGVIEKEEPKIRWRIRKLTPLECWRLMNFTDKDCIRAAQYISPSAQYKQAGNSIVVACLIAIFSSLFIEYGYKAEVWTKYQLHYWD